MLLGDIALVVFGVVMFGALVYTVATRDGRGESWTGRQRRDLRKWRKQRGFRRHEAPIGDTPVPFYPPERSVPAYSGVPLRSVDRLPAALRRVFSSRPKPRE